MEGATQKAAGEGQELRWGTQSTVGGGEASTQVPSPEPGERPTLGWARQVGTKGDTPSPSHLGCFLYVLQARGHGDQKGDAVVL
jgi:hypothetical protein